MLTLDALDSRRSTPTRQLAEPGPGEAQLLRMLQTAVRVPDHGKRVPFRFLRIAGAAREALADAVVLRLRERACEQQAQTGDEPHAINRRWERGARPHHHRQPATTAVHRRAPPS